MVHHARNHLAPAGATASGITNSAADTMTISLLNHIALDWVTQLGLRDIVETEFGVELKNGTMLCNLVPRIAHSVDTLLKRTGQASVNKVVTDASGGDEYQQSDYYDDGDAAYTLYVGQGPTRGFGWRPDRGAGRGPRRSYNRSSGGRGFTGRGGYPAAAASRPPAGRPIAGRPPFCPTCRLLGQELRLRVDFNHLPADCPRRTATSNMVYNDNGSTDMQQPDGQDMMQYYDLHQPEAEAIVDGEDHEVSKQMKTTTFEPVQNSPTTFRTEQQRVRSTSNCRQTCLLETEVFNNIVQQPFV